ncbi:MAG: hypothetical protein H6919_11300 [Sphingomonadaceae bacterium]|nr:hypothetical protein [Sphingomonadaceae bacterium]MCP5383538.1 hypothetical protein [Altererythrobacter sp.]MCP5394480.1 hypothetical protein [Sphingomonadaceae bacterium]
MTFRNALPRAAALAVLFLGAGSTAAHTTAPEPEVRAAASQFESISALVGEWDVKEQGALKIVFEPTARGTVILEKWMVGERMHSLTVYHTDGDALLATHYCPQGNQPRLAATTGEDGTLRFTFRDATDLEEGESYQHDLSLRINTDGTVSRAETYWGPEGAGEESTLTLSRVAQPGA